MKRRKEQDIIVTITTADGITFTGEEWMKKRRVFSYEANKELCDDYARRVDPAFRAQERARRNFEWVEARRRQLEEERREIDRQLAALSRDAHGHDNNR